MKKESLWLDLEKEQDIETLKQDIEVDVLIIGGGITGLTTLYYLKDSHFNVCLVDQDLIGHGVSGKTTGKITYLQETVYYDISKKYSVSVAKQYFQSQKKAIEAITNIIEKERISCDLENVTSYVFTNTNEEISKVKMERKILKSFGAVIEEHHKPIGKFQNLYAISASDTYVFHPVKYLRALKRICKLEGKKVYERTRILGLLKEKNGYVAKTKDAHIRAKKVVLACHYPFFLLPYFLPLKANIEKSYVTASLSKFKPISMITASKPTQSIRYHKAEEEYAIYLSNSSNLCNQLSDEENFNEVIDGAHKLSLQPCYIWKNDDLMTVDSMPYIGEIEKNNPNLLMGTGYNTWGMTNGTLAGILLSDMILERENEFIPLCSPKRVLRLKHIGSLVGNVASSAKGYIQNKISKNKKWYPKAVHFQKLNGKNVAIYDDGEERHIVYNKCPHMGCSLIFNEVEKTWDCPCHASRFDIDGNCIKGPSCYSITYRK